MTTPSETRRLPKWIFVLGDILLVGAAWVIEAESAKPLTVIPIIGIVVCVALATVFFVVPFMADYARNQEEALAERQRALQALAATVTASAEQISIAASGLDRLAAIAQENFNQSDRVAQQIKGQMDGLHERLAEAKRDDAESAERLEAVAKTFAKSVADLESARRSDGESAERLEAVARKVAKTAAEPGIGGRQGGGAGAGPGAARGAPGPGQPDCRDQAGGRAVRSPVYRSRGPARPASGVSRSVGV